MTLNLVEYVNPEDLVSTYNINHVVSSLQNFQALVIRNQQHHACCKNQHFNFKLIKEHIHPYKQLSNVDN